MSNRQGKWGLLGFAISVLLNSGCFAAASTFEPKLADVCSKSPNKPGVLVLDHRMLVGQLVEKYLGVSPIDLDTKGGGISQVQEAEALLNPETFCKTSACADKLTDKLGNGIIYLQNFINRHAVPPDPAKDSINTAKLVSGDPDTQLTLIKEFVRGHADPDVAICSPAAKASQGAGSSQVPRGARTANQQPPSADIPQFFSLRQNVEDLPIPQSSPNFKGVKQASLSFTDDRIAQKASFSIAAAAGYTFGPYSIDPAGHYIGQLTPFILYNQQTVQTPSPKTSSTAENIGFGLLGNLTFPVGIGDAYQNMKVYPKYVESLRNGAEVFSGNFVYTPMYGIPGIDSAVSIIPDSLSAKLTPEVKFVANDVINRGTGTTALKNGGYYWIGPYVDLKLFGEGIFSGFTYDVSYETYDVFAGLLKQISYFQTTLAYDFGSAKLMSIMLTYQYGRNLDTLEKLNIVTLGLGLKY
jgi:hypothetical protein